MRTVYLCLIPKIHRGFQVYLKILVLILEVDYVLNVAFLKRCLFVVFADYFAKGTCSEDFRFNAVLMIVAGCN